jgi:hypothetical protein
MSMYIYIGTQTSKQIQSMFKTNKINKAKQNQNQKQHKQTQMKKNTCELKSLTTKKNTTYVDVHPGPTNKGAAWSISYGSRIYNYQCNL